MREGRERRIGEDEQRSLLDTGGEGGSSSNKDLLFPHTAADIVQLQQLCPLFFFLFYIFLPQIIIPILFNSIQFNSTRDRVRLGLNGEEGNNNAKEEREK